MPWLTIFHWRHQSRGHEQPWDIGEFYGQSYFCDPRGQFIAEAPARSGCIDSRRSRSRQDSRSKNTWQFFRDAGRILTARWWRIKSYMHVRNKADLFSALARNQAQLRAYRQPLGVLGHLRATEQTEESDVVCW